MKEIELTKGYKALVDDEDYEYLSQFSWRVSIKPRNCYAITSMRSSETGKQHTVLMHRLIMAMPAGLNEVDHRDNDDIAARKLHGEFALCNFPFAA